jgi:hypothetical protein
MGSGMAPPAPKLMSCIFDNTGGFLIATFDSPTDEAGVTTSTFVVVRSKRQSTEFAFESFFLIMAAL